MRGLKIPVAKEGGVFILPLAAATGILGGSGLLFPAAFFLLLTLFVIYFFRDPERQVPKGGKNILSSADGRIIQIETCIEERFLRGPATRISVFMSLFDVHVNRIPFPGHIADTAYTPGMFARANLNQASATNEQNALFIEGADGMRIVVVQIAGLIARRIVCRVQKGDAVERGDRFGLIRFGSRLDIYVPQCVRIQAKVGQKAYAGQTILGTVA